MQSIISIQKTKPPNGWNNWRKLCRIICWRQQSSKCSQFSFRHWSAGKKHITTALLFLLLWCFRNYFPFKVKKDRELWSENRDVTYQNQRHFFYRRYFPFHTSLFFFELCLENCGSVLTDMAKNMKTFFAQRKRSSPLISPGSYWSSSHWRSAYNFEIKA